MSGDVLEDDFFLKPSGFSKISIRDAPGLGSWVSSRFLTREVGGREGKVFALVGWPC